MSRLRKWFYNLKFRTKILVAYALLVALPLLGVGSVMYVETRRSLGDQIAGVLEHQLVQTATALDQLIQGQQNVLEIVSANSELLRLLGSRQISDYAKYEAVNRVVRPLFVSIMSLRDDIEEVSVVTSNPLYVNYAPFIRKTDSLEVDLVEHGFAPSQVTYLYTPWHESDAPTLIMVRPVITLSPEFLAIAVQPNMASIDRIIDAEFTEPGLLELVGPDGTVIASSVNVQGLVMPDWSDRPPGVHQTPDGDSLYATVPVPTPSWDLRYLAPMESFRQLTTKGLLRLIATFALFLSIGVGLMFPTSRFVVARLNTLNREVEHIADGSREEVSSSPYSDEVGSLHNNVKRMHDHIRLLIQDVQKKEQLHKEAELHALQAQINPHFIYNAFSLISSMAIKSDNDEISEIVSMLSDYYRNVFPGGSFETTVGAELDSIARYLEITKRIHGAGFVYTLQCSPEVSYESVPSMLLLPLAENAVKHGVMPLINEHGYIEVRAERDVDRIVFKVLDNGRGSGHDSHSSSGYGLVNVRTRLDYLFGARATLSVAPRNDARGTVARISIPI